MGQKIQPNGFRIGINRTWDFRYFAKKKDYARSLHETLRLTSFLEKNLQQAALARVIVERPNGNFKVTVLAERPGVIIGKKGAGIEKIRDDLAALFPKYVVEFYVLEVRRPELEARLVAEDVVQQMKKGSFRRAMKRAVQTTMKAGALGIWVKCSGRLGGAEIARSEQYREGRVPLHTLRASIDYHAAVAKMSYGTCGVKVIIHRPAGVDRAEAALQERRIASSDPVAGYFRSTGGA